MSTLVNRRRLLLLALLALAAGLPLVLAGPPQGKRYAVLVGINQYEHRRLPALRYAKNDATELAAVLKKAGYEVMLLTDATTDDSHKPTKANIEKHIHDVLRQCRKGDTVVLAFAGHGLQFEDRDNPGKGECFFCPADGRPFRDEMATLVSLTRIYAELEKSFAGMKVLLVDACRNDPGSDRGIRGLNADSATQPPRGVAALFSCGAGEHAYETSVLKHGVFFYYVLEGLRGKAKDADDGEVTFAGLASYVSKRVARQVPQLFGEDARQSPNLKADYDVDPVLLVVRDSPRSEDHGAVREERQPGGSQPQVLDCTSEDGVSAEEVRKAQQAWAKYLGRKVEEEVEVAEGVKMTLVLVPPGKFMMGSPADEKDRHEGEVLHQVTLTQPFYLGKYEVTQKQYEALIGNNPSKFKGDNNPVETVSWEKAQDYAAKLTKKRADGQTYRLPTEAEWEYSCRGGRPCSKPFGIGDGRSLSSRQANFNGNSPYGDGEKGPYLGATCAVGSYPANALGLFDMHGNVWEWCQDWYGNYPPEEVTDPVGPSEGSSRVYRGGGWYDGGSGCRSVDRNAHVPGYRFYYLGFRLARAIR